MKFFSTVFFLCGLSCCNNIGSNNLGEITISMTYALAKQRILNSGARQIDMSNRSFETFVYDENKKIYTDARFNYFYLSNDSVLILTYEKNRKGEMVITEIATAVPLDTTEFIDLKSIKYYDTFKLPKAAGDSKKE